jgi:hypothetical protein
MVAKLQKAGTLDLYLQRASDQTGSLLVDLIDSGGKWHEAREQASREELFLPAEEDAPDLVLPPL